MKWKKKHIEEAGEIIGAGNIEGWNEMKWPLGVNNHQIERKWNASFSAVEKNIWRHQMLQSSTSREMAEKSISEENREEADNVKKNNQASK